MPQPYSYTLNAQDPTTSLLNTLAVASQLKQQKAAEIKAEEAATLKKQLGLDLATLGSNPSPAALSKIMVKYPSLSEEFKRTYDVLDAEQQKSRIGQASKVYSALLAGQPQIAQELLKEQTEAARNSGNEEDAKAAETISKLIDLSPETAQTSAGLFLATTMGGEKFTETFTKLRSERREAALEPAQLTEQQAKAREAAVKAKFTESIVVTDLQKKGWDIYRIQEDTKIARENLKLATLQTEMDKERNDLKKDELKIKLAELQRKRDEAVKERIADVESANSNIDNMLNTADRILKTPIGVIEDATGPIESRLPTVGQDVADFEALIENIDAQAFLAQIPNIKGMGSLSDAEGRKLAAALQNFNLKQSPQRLVENVREAQRLLLKARSNVSARYGVPETIPDTPAVETKPEDINALVQKYAQPVIK